MDGKEFARAAHKLLQSELRSRGRGTITEVEDALGMPRRTIIRMRQENLLRVADLHDILGHLGIHTSTFFRRLETKLKHGTVPSGCGGGLSGLSRRSNRDDETLALLRDADEMRYNDPVAALRAVSDLRPQVSRETAHLYFSVGGSCYRSLDLFDQARACLGIAFQAAESDRELAACHQRIAYTFLLHEPERGLSEVEKAYSLYEDEVNKAKSMVDLATFNRALGRLDLSRDFASSALMNGEIPRRFVVAAHQELALVDLETGSCASGLRRLELALDAAGEVPERSTKGNLFGLMGQVCRKISYYDMAIHTFGEHFPFEALAAGLEKCYLVEERETQEQTLRALRAFCRHPAYQRFLDHVYAVVHMGSFGAHTFDFSRVRKRWRDSRTRGMKVLAAGHD